MIPPAINTALARPHDREFLLQLEDKLVLFVESGTESYTILAESLKNSYYRMLSHQLCLYYGLKHQNNNDDIVVTINGKHCNVQRLSQVNVTKLKVTIKKNPEKNQDLQRQQRNQEHQNTRNNQNRALKQSDFDAAYAEIKNRVFQDDKLSLSLVMSDTSDKEVTSESSTASSTGSGTAPSIACFSPASYSSNGFSPNLGYPFAPIPFVPGSFSEPPAHFYPYVSPPSVYPTHFPYEYYPYSYQPRCDRETERRILNNPYIILPDYPEEVKPKGQKGRRNQRPNESKKAKGHRNQKVRT